MNDNCRLLKLLSPVAWTTEDHFGLRFQDNAVRDRIDEEEETASALHNACTRYAGAARHHRDGSDALDAKELLSRSWD